METRSETQQACEVFSRFYLKVSRDCRLKGLDSDAVVRSSDELSQLRYGKYYLHPKAFKPTGIALGFPLPDSFFIQLLWRISNLIEKHLQKITNGNMKAFAHVPPDNYHITIVNRTHFDKHSDVFQMNNAEKSKSEDIITNINPGQILLFLNGLILSRSVSEYLVISRFLH